jgi:SAM-dependent methyltransferase
MQTHVVQRRLPPAWVYVRPKALPRRVCDLLFAPLRMALLPDGLCERVGLTSLRGERFAAVLPVLRGKLVDVGAGDNALIHLYRDLRQGQADADLAAQSIGIDVVDWGSDCLVVESSARLPLADESVDTVAFVACLNHIPERREALHEARRILKPGGRVVVTMIGRLLGEIGHRIWWYSEDKHREVHVEEAMGLDREEVLELLRSAGFANVVMSTFLYGLNTLYVATK